MSKLILSEARKLNLKVEILDDRKNFYIISKGDKRIIIKETFCVQKDLFSDGIAIARNKNITYKLLEKNIIPIPLTYYFKNARDIIKKTSFFKYPLIIKENTGEKSKNLLVNIRNRAELSQKINKIKNSENDYIVQRMAKGKEYRVLVFNGQVIACLNLIPPYVVGDGSSNIKKLIRIKNKEIDKKIKINQKIKETLIKEGIDLNFIPRKNRIIYLQNNSCLSEGGVSIDCTEKIHPSIAKLAIKSVEAVFLDLGGVDLICRDISISAKEQELSVLEVNGRPDISIHHRPTKGAKRNVAQIIFKKYFNM